MSNIPASWKRNNLKCYEKSKKKKEKKDEPKSK